MFLTKAKIAIAALIAVTLFAAGGGALTYQAPAAKEEQPRPAAAAKDADKGPVHALPPGGSESRKVKPPAANAGRKTGETFVYRGRVLGPDGRPIAGAKLYLASPGDVAKSPPMRATTGTDGRFTFAAARAEFVPAEAPAEVDVFSFLQVVAVAKGYGPDWTMIEKRPTGELTLRLTKNDVSIDGRILDLEGKAVAGAKVRVLRLETTPEDRLAPFLKTWKSQRDWHLALGRLTKILYDPSVAGLPKTVTTGADGRFHLAGAGNEQIVTLSLEAPRIEHAMIRVLPRTAAEVKALVQTSSENMMRMGALPPPTVYGSTFDHLGIPARMIVGTVRDKETGKPMKSVRVSGNARVTGNAVDGPGETHVETYTDKRGRYQLHGLPKATKYELFAWPGDFSFYIPGGQTVSGGAGLTTARADFELMRGVEVRGRVTDKVTGKRIAAGVSYVPLGGNRHAGAAFFRMVSKACDGPRIGTFREMVPPGPGVFLVRVRAADDENPYTQVRLDPAERAKTGLNEFMLHGVNAYRVIHVPADAKSLTCDIQVDPGRRLTGTVLGPDGKPLAGAMVKGLTAIWPTATPLKTAEFTVVALDPREPRQLMFVHVKRKLAGKLVVRGDEKGDVTVRLKPWGTLTGRILDEDGKPMAGVGIQLGFPHSMFFLPVTWWASPQGEVIKTDRDGCFRAEGLTPGMKVRMSASSARKFFLPLAGTPDGMRELSVRSGETKDLGDLKIRPD